MVRDDVVSRVIGVMVFVGGIALLAVVFFLAYRYFSTDMGALQTEFAPKPATGPTEDLGHSALKMLGSIALLIVMALVGSLLAGKGLQLYFAANGREAPPRSTHE